MSFDRNLLPDPVSYFAGQGLTLAGRGKWRTTACQFHDGSDSMRINTASGGWVCMSCDMHGGNVLDYHLQVHGLEFVDAVRQLGAWVDDGKPLAQYKPTPLSPRAAIQALAFESNLVAVAAGNVAQGVMLSDLDRMRLMVAAGRIARIAEAFA